MTPARGAIVDRIRSGLDRAWIAAWSYTHQRLEGFDAARRLERDLLVNTITIAKTIKASGLTDGATIPMMMPAIVNPIQRITRNE